jgi:hypothetical protein
MNKLLSQQNIRYHRQAEISIRRKHTPFSLFQDSYSTTKRCRGIDDHLQTLYSNDLYMEYLRRKNQSMVKKSYQTTLFYFFSCHKENAQQQCRLIYFLTI